jgi:hypothetical protein
VHDKTVFDVRSRIVCGWVISIKAVVQLRLPIAVAHLNKASGQFDFSTLAEGDEMTAKTGMADFRRGSFSALVPLKLHPRNRSNLFLLQKHPLRLPHPLSPDLGAVILQPHHHTDIWESSRLDDFTLE